MAVVVIFIMRSVTSPWRSILELRRLLIRALDSQIQSLESFWILGYQSFLSLLICESLVFHGRLIGQPSLLISFKELTIFFPYYRDLSENSKKPYKKF
jgi:hypothetical protein